jgi:hypothetical protein
MLISRAQRVSTSEIPVVIIPLIAMVTRIPGALPTYLPFNGLEDKIENPFWYWLKYI